MSTERVRLRIHGRVQGVWFRASTEAEARRLGVVGWVRNSADGSVEVVAEGETEVLDRFVAWCRTGPPAARVDRVEVHRSPPTGELSEFSVR